MKSRYEISIVTPVHNVDIEFFKNGVNSIKNQTYGFENIEWVVVLHNCEPECIKGAHELLDGYDNVIIDELNNDKKTPSSPRNRGMDLATGRYIGFLDADDSYLPDCVERVLGYIKKNNAQVAVFRREYELETKDAIPVTEIVLWDQTREEIVMEKGSWDEEKMFTGLFGLVTSRIYDLDFLNANNLRYDESVLFGEDYLYNFEVYGKIDRVVYLPQLIGYHYFINSGSLVQSGKKSAELIIQYAYGYKKIFQKALDYGFYANSVISRLCVVLTRFIIACEDMTREQRELIRDILKPYIDKTFLMMPTKVYNAAKVKECYEVPRRIIVDMEDLDSKDADDFMYMHGYSKKGVDVALMSLAEILSDNAETDMGKRYGFSDIITMTGYQAKVPMSTYETYEPWIKLTTRIGESGIFLRDKITAYLERIGSDGAVKRYPCTEKSMEGYYKAFNNVIGNRKTILFFESFQRDIVYNDSAYLSNVSGMVLDNFFNKKLTNSIGNDYFTSPKELLFPSKIENLKYLRMLYALKDRDAKQIVSSYAWIILESFQLLEREWKSLCDTIETGDIPSYWCQNTKLWEHLNDSLKPDSERANELRSIFSEGFNEPIVNKIWPKLDRVVANGIGVFSIYRDELKKYIGNISWRNGVYTLGENYVGRAIGDSDEFELMLDDIFYEFVPVTDLNAIPLFYKDIVVGGEYELIITTNSGLYRYRTGAVIRIVETGERRIVFKPVYNINHATKFTSENGIGIFGENHLYEAIKELQDEYDIKIVDYLYMNENSSLGVLGLKVYLELPGDEAIQAKVKEIGKDRINASLAKAIYNALKIDNAADKLNIIVNVEYLQPESQILRRELHCYKNQLPEDQMMPFRKLVSENDIRYENAMILEL